MKLAIGTRGSQLALWQTNWVKAQLTAAGHEVEVLIIKTTGDKLESLPLAGSGTKGLFIKELEEALLDSSVDLAVHSMKDLPTDLPAGLAIIAVPEREDPRDVLISTGRKHYSELPAGARVGTSSLRRQSQLRKLRGDLELVPLRGNLDTRLRKLDRGDCAAIVLAAAGVHRLGWSDRITQYFGAVEVCPAVGQGALAIEARSNDERVAGALRPLDHAPTHRAVRAERALLRHLGGGCQVPIAAHAVAGDAEIKLIAVVAAVDGSAVIRTTASGPASDPEAVGRKAAEDLLAQGAREILMSL